MRIQVMDDYEQLSYWAARVVLSQVTLQSNSVLGLATGSTPEGMYQRLVDMYQQGKVDFSEVTTFALDEYLGLSPDHPQSYQYYLYNKFFNHINLPPENINLPPGDTTDPEMACQNYEQAIASAGGIDLQVVGIGVNGHIGFNEPASSLNTDTHIVDLAEETIQANSRFFDNIDEVPRQAITMGMGSIMGAKRIVMLANGKNKAAAVRDSFSGKVTTEVPASFLQLHREFILLLDKEAASML